MCEHLDGMEEDGVADLVWSMEYTNGAGDSILLTRNDVEHLLHSLMHHRLLRVDVAFPEHCTEALERATFGTGHSIAITYEGDDVITLDIDARDLNGWRTQAVAKKVEAERKKKGGAK